MGEPLKNFNFNYYQILPCSNSKDTVNAWFFVRKNDSENYILINVKGEVKFEKEFISYPFTSNLVFGYIVFGSKDNFSLFDMYNLEWIVKPQNKFKIFGIYYSSSKSLNQEIVSDRKKAKTYYLIEDGENQYFVDVLGKKYLPQ